MTSRPLAASGQAGSISTSVPLLVLTVLRGAYVDPASGKVPFGEWAERWYASTAALRPSTRRDYRKSLDLEVLPRFRDLSLAAIDTLMVREWLAGLAKRGLGAKRAGKALQVLSQVLASAVEGDRLARNVAAGVRKPKVQRRETAFLSAAQVERLAEAVGPPYDTLVRFTAYTGLRPCELTALRVGRVDVLAATVRVCEAAPEVDGRLEWGGVKTHEARTVRLPRFLATELGTHLAGRPHDAEALVFTAPRGGPLRFSKWTDARYKEGDSPGERAHHRDGQARRAAGAAAQDAAGVRPPPHLRVAEQMDRARAVAVAGLSRTESGPVVVPVRETAGQRPGRGAEEVGFEPTGPSQARRLSRSLPSAARPLLREGVYLEREGRARPPRAWAQRLAGSRRSVPR